MQMQRILLLLAFLLLAWVPCGNAKATGCVVTLDLTEPAEPVHLPVPAQDGEKKFAMDILTMAGIAFSLIPVVGPFMSAGALSAAVMFGMIPEPTLSTEKAVNDAMDKLLRYTKDMLEYRLAKDKIDLMRVKLVSLANSFIRVRDFQPFTPGGFAALRILHSQYLDDVESFFHNSTKPEETYYEKIMPFIQTYTVSYMTVSRLYIDFLKQDVVYECGRKFPASLRLSTAGFNATARARREARDPVERCKHARGDLNTTYLHVIGHHTRLQQLIRDRVVPTLQAKYYGEPFAYDASLQKLRKRLGKSGSPWSSIWTFDSPNLSMQVDGLQSKWHETFWSGSMTCTHQLSRIFTCTVENSIGMHSTRFRLVPKSQLENDGVRCLDEVNGYTEQYRTGPMLKVKQFIEDAVNSYITVLQDSIDKIDGDRSETNSFLGQYYQD